MINGIDEETRHRGILATYVRRKYDIFALSNIAPARHKILPKTTCWIADAPVCRSDNRVHFLSAVGPARAADTTVVTAESAVHLGLSGGYGSYEENVSPQDMEADALLGGSFNLSDLMPGVLGRWGFSDVYADASYGFVGGFLTYKGEPAEQPRNSLSGQGSGGL